MVCKECGKTKNRHESFYTISCQVKDINNIHDSLQKETEGDIINDFKCDGCNKTVDLAKRSLYAEMPNVLILHLKRLEYDFEKDGLDKVNSYFEFPNVLDMKPYSYFEVMQKEGLLPKEKTEEEKEAEVIKNKDLTKEEL